MSKDPFLKFKEDPLIFANSILCICLKGGMFSCRLIRFCGTELGDIHRARGGISLYGGGDREGCTFSIGERLLIQNWPNGDLGTADLLGVYCELSFIFITGKIILFEKIV
jgi:hypothetical protein